MAKSSQPLKIGFVLDGGLEKPDGVQQYILNLGQWFKSQGHEVRYLVAGRIDPPNQDAISLSRNVHVISNGNRLAIPLPASRSRLKDFMAREKFNVLHVQTPYSPMMGEQLIFLADDSTAVIGTFHIVPKSWYLAFGNWLLGRWCYLSLRRFDKMLSVSSAAQKIAKRDFWIDSEILPNVVDFNYFAAAKGRYNDDIPTILFFGRLVPRKGPQLLLMAVDQLKKTRPELKFRVVVCGGGPLESKLKTFVAHNDLEETVEFVGFVKEEDKASYYASADIAVFPSNGGESFGIVLLEAMASGKTAVLAGDNEGYRSVLAEKPELLFDPNDAGALANKLAQFLEDNQLRQTMARWGQDYAATFDVKLIGAKLLDIYAEALLKRSER